MLKYNVFLSHNSADKPAVEEIARRLVKADIQPWLDTWNLIPGEPWQEALEEALGACQTVVVFLGPNGLGPWENEEMRSALEERVRDKCRRVIPVLLPGAPDPREQPLPRFLRRLTWVDFRAGLADEHIFRRLAAGIRGLEPGSGPAKPVAPAGVSPAAVLPSPEVELVEQRASLRRQHQQHRRNLNQLREQAAGYSANEIPLHLLNNIAAEERRIEAVQDALASLTLAEDNPSSGET